MEEPKESLVEIDLRYGSTQGFVESDSKGKETEMSYKNTKQLDSNIVEYTACPNDLKKDITKELYQILSLSMSCIIQEIDKRKKDENRINSELMWFSSRDKQMKSMIQRIKYFENAPGEVKPHLPMRSIPRTSGFLHLTEKDGATPIYVGTDKKRCHNRIKKGRMDLEYMKQVQEDLMSSMKSGERPVHGAQELNYVMESLVHKIQHGNSKQAEEAKLYHEIRKLNETIEIYTAPEPADPPKWRGDPGGSRRRRAYYQQYQQHQLKLLLNQLEEAQNDQKIRTLKGTRLKVELDVLKKNIRYMERVLEKVSLRRMKVMSGEQKKKGKSSYSEYELLMTYVKELAGKGDIVELMQVCNKL
ncbi:hypothetical protein CTI12_AA473820 [Artemisia annua]|uniref:Uncharacterized protein n=1 Tax=Artemisia annua TaxID=35608 RepID=A0A2U1LMX8_ARTAN|nr:hypothetical protein CTI12_AA473820 [Artemisia annua]